MKLLFFDELKYDIPKSNLKVYGLAGVMVDAVYYTEFKKSFNLELDKIGWDKKHELKGKSMFSTDGDSKVNTSDRLQFISKVVNLSKSSSGKTAKIHTYLSVEPFQKDEAECECYLKNLKKIICKLPKPSSIKKSLMFVSYDANSCINSKFFRDVINVELTKRGYTLFESPYPVNSSMDYPGILFADYVCYFHQTYFQLTRFRKENMESIIQLLEKDAKGILSEAEFKTLESHFTNYKKEKKTVEMIVSLKKIVYV